MQTVRSGCASVAFGATLLSLGGASAADIETSPPPTVEYGAHLKPDGWVDFGLRAPSADTVDLLIYDTADASSSAVTPLLIQKIAALSNPLQPSVNY